MFRNGSSIWEWKGMQRILIMRLPSLTFCLISTVLLKKKISSFKVIFKEDNNTRVVFERLLNSENALPKEKSAYLDEFCL